MNTRIAWIAAIAVAACSFALAQDQAAKGTDQKAAAAKGAPAKGGAAKGAPRPTPPEDIHDPLVTDPVARSQAIIPECQIKPVMTDDEIDVCKRTAKR